MGRFKLKLLLERENTDKTKMLSKIVVLCAVAHVSLACFEFNTGYLGSPRGSNGVGRVEDIPTAYECQVACQNEPACEFWTWNSPDWRARQGICYFKSNKGGSVRGRRQAGRVSGPKFCWMKKAATEATVGTDFDLHRISGPE